MDGGGLVRATYNLEGNGALAFCAYEIVNTILASIGVSHFPNLEAVGKELCPGNPVGQQQWTTYGLQCLQPGYDYLTHIFSTTLSSAVAAFKAARLFNLTRYRKFSHQHRIYSPFLCSHFSVD